MNRLDNLPSGLMSASAINRVIGAVFVAILLWIAIAWAVMLP
jgi:tetrahydromethanopterin S-methyltransferase subunit F